MDSKVVLVAVFTSTALSACITESAIGAEVVAVGEACSDGSGTGGRPYDAERGCLDAPVLICAESGLTEAHGCAQDASTGALYRTDYPLAFDRTEAWIHCAPNDTALVMNAVACTE